MRKIKIIWGCSVLYIGVLACLRLSVWQAFDTAVALSIIAARTSFLSAFFLTFTQLASATFITSVTIIIILILIWQRRLQWAKTVTVVTSASFLLNDVMKMIFTRTRPSFAPLTIETSFSFPSGHACAATVLAGLLIMYMYAQSKQVVLRRLTLWCGILYVLLIGVSCMYLCVHWFTDVIGGYLTGLFVLGLTFLDKKSQT